MISLTRARRLARATAAALVVAAFSSPVAAEEYRFGAAYIDFDGNRVLFTNGPTASAHDRDFHRDLTAGITVRVIVMQGTNPAPDTFSVIPPAGYIAVPELLTVEEGAAGVIIITLEGLS